MINKELNDLYQKLADEQKDVSKEEVKDSIDTDKQDGSSDSTDDIEEDEIEVPVDEVDNEQQESEESTESPTDQEIADNGEDVDIFEDWDSESPSDVVQDSEIKIDYSELSKELGLEFNSKDELASVITDLKKRAEAEPDYSDLPEVLRDAVKMAKEGQDFSVLFDQPDGIIDHTMYDDHRLLKEQYAEFFADSDGKIDEEGLDEYIDEMSDVQKRLEVKKIRVGIDQYNERLKAEKKQAALESRKIAETELKNAISELKEVKGFKVTPNHKKEMFSAISSGEAAKEMFFKDDGSYDMGKLSEVYFIYKNFDKIKNFLVSRARNQTRKEDFENISNADVSNPRQTQVNPADNPKRTGFDMWLEELQAKHNIT